MRRTAISAAVGLAVVCAVFVLLPEHAQARDGHRGHHGQGHHGHGYRGYGHSTHRYYGHSYRPYATFYRPYRYYSYYRYPQLYRPYVYVPSYYAPSPYGYRGTFPRPAQINPGYYYRF